MTPSNKQPTKRHRDFEKAVVQRRKRRLKAERQKGRGIWMGMGMFGLVGWSVAVPTLAGLFLGLWLDARTETNFSWAFALMAGGLTLGLINVWNWMQKTASEDNEEEDDS